MQPPISIILPVRNEEKYIVGCLRSITVQDYPHDCMEILVIDGRSTDSTIDKVNEFKAEPFDIAQGKSSKLKEIQVLDNPKKIVSAGLNIGFRAARGDIIMRMDAHAEYGRDYISQCLAALEKSGAANVGGPALALPGGPGPMAQAIALAHYSPFGLGGGQFRNPGAEGFVETVWPGCFRREVFEKVGYIDERRTRTEDLEFNTRLRAAGYQIFITPLIRAHYYCRTTLRQTWRQRWADGWEITRFLPDNPKAPRLRHFIPLLFVSTILLLIMASSISYSGPTPPYPPRSGEGLVNGFGPIALLLLALVLGAYFGAMAVAVIMAALSEKRKAESGKNDQFKEGQSIHNGDKMGMPSANNRMSTESPSCVNGMSTVTPSHNNIMTSLLLLPIVFMTLHFSYGLGSLWGLISLPCWAARKKR